MKDDFLPVFAQFLSSHCFKGPINLWHLNGTGKRYDNTIGPKMKLLHQINLVKMSPIKLSKMKIQ